MTQLNSLSAYLWKLWRVSRSLPNDASSLDRKTCRESSTHPSNLIEYILVLPRWSMILLANIIWWFDGLVREWHSIDASLAISGRGIAAVKLIDLTLLVCKYPLRCGLFQQFYPNSSGGNSTPGCFDFINMLYFAMILSIYKLRHGHRWLVWSYTTWTSRNHSNGPT